MDCAPNDFCHEKRVQEYRADEQIDRSMVVLGVFNGRAYTYYEQGGKSVIMIVNSTPDLKPVNGKIGKFEVPDAVPADFIEYDGAEDTEGDNDNG